MSETLSNQRERRNRTSAIVLALVAVGFFAAFIIAMIVRGQGAV